VLQVPVKALCKGAPIAIHQVLLLLIVYLLILILVLLPLIVILLLLVAIQAPPGGLVAALAARSVQPQPGAAVRFPQLNPPHVLPPGALPQH